MMLIIKNLNLIRFQSWADISGSLSHPQIKGCQVCTPLYRKDLCPDLKDSLGMNRFSFAADLALIAYLT